MYRIKNWTKFQHYRGRRILWIKLHIALLSDVDYLSLTDKGKLTLIHCWMVGGEVWNQEKEVEPLLTSNQKLLKSLLKLDGNLRVNELKRAGYLILVSNDYNNLKPIPASNGLAKCLQVDVDVDVDVEKTKDRSNGKVQKPEGVDGQTWNDWVILRKNKRAPITETVLSRIKKQADKAGITLSEALAESCERGWAGFKADWYKKKSTTNSTSGPHLPEFKGDS